MHLYSSLTNTHMIAVVFNFLCFFFLFLKSSFISFVVHIHNGKNGQTVSFVTDIREPPNEILWKHDGNKVVEFDGSEQKAFGSYEHRVTLDWHSADLTISNLRYEDSGLYELETYINNKLDRKQYQLEVIGKFFFFALFNLSNNNF
uniref:Immunoglobulin domain-containing protein n=1 Tax=Cyprinodon variegatus TaxID=28743 RepID=A0A3Q2GC05_CYPVA